MHTAYDIGTEMFAIRVNDHETTPRHSSIGNRGTVSRRRQCAARTPMSMLPIPTAATSAPAGPIA